MKPSDLTPELLNEMGKGQLTDRLGIEITHIGDRTISAQMSVEPFLLAPNGFLHAGSVVTLADSCAGIGCALNLPQGATGFTTVELKSNHMGTCRDGVIECTASAVHSGRTTQVWDATVKDKQRDKVIVLFRCTQVILYNNK